MTWQGSLRARPGKGLNNHDPARVVAYKVWQGPQQIRPGKGQGEQAWLVPQ